MVPTPRNTSSRWTRSHVLAVLAATGAIAATALPAAAAPIAGTDTGPVRGLTANGMDEYLGIPYAASPVGPLRWAPPQPAARWQGVRDATQFGNHCPQVASPFGLASVTEDCLFLNVFTPARGHAGAAQAEGLLPVMVWIHGGALLVGESDDYDPAPLVRNGVVVVTLNYRLGVLGFFAHPALSAESPSHSSGNYGLMDQQAALRWVQRNIVRFRGDPGRVTIFGESAGGLSVHSQLASPLAAGLFHGAIVESGAYALAQPSLAAAEAAGSAVAARAGCSDQTLTCLRAASVETLLMAMGAASVVPDVDGTVLPRSVGAALASGLFNRVPVVEGSNHDEWRLFVALDFDLVNGPITPAGYPSAIQATLGVPAALVPVFMAFYPLANYPSPDLALSALGTDAIFACNSRKAIRLLSQFVPTFAYEFNDENAPQRFLPPVSFPYGAAHASELQYLFDLRPSVPATPLAPDQQQLSDAMAAYWTSFARSATPSAPGAASWAPYDPATDEMISLVPPAPVVETGFAADHKCALWTPTP